MWEVFAVAVDVAYVGRDNAVRVQLLDDGEPVDLSSVERIVLELNGGEYSVDSEQHEDLFDWQEGDGIVTVFVGRAGVPAGLYDARLIVYDPLWTNGIVWDGFKIALVD